ASPNYGYGNYLVDPGFNASTLTAWAPTGDVIKDVNSNGDNVIKMNAVKSSISQTVEDLVPGQQYSFSADIEIALGKQRAVTLSATGTGLNATWTFNSSPLQNKIAADSKYNTYSQRVYVTFKAPSDGVVKVMISAAAANALVTIDDARIMKSTASWTPQTGDTQGGKILYKEDFEGNQPGFGGAFLKGAAGGSSDHRTSISWLNDPYSQKAWKNLNSPFNAGALDGKATDDVLTAGGSLHSLKIHEENSGVVLRTAPSTVQFVNGHAYKVEFDYQNVLVGKYSFVVGSDRFTGTSVTAVEYLLVPFMEQIETKRFSLTFTAGCGDETWVGVRNYGGDTTGADLTIDNLLITDLGVTTTPAVCATLAASLSGEYVPEGQSTVTTTFTNRELTPAYNVAVTIPDVPAGWTVQTTVDGGNVSAQVAAGGTFTTTWLITPPLSAAGQSVEFHPVVTYAADCQLKTVDTTLAGTVATRKQLPLSSMTMSADSQHATSGSEGPASNVKDGNTGTIWHTKWASDSGGAGTFPHWIRIDSGASGVLMEAFGYLPRQSGNNGFISDYGIEVSDNGSTWTEVARGTFPNSRDWQVVEFDPAIQTRYVRLVVYEDYGSEAAYGAAAELRIYGESSAAPTPGFAPAARGVDDSCVVVEPPEPPPYEPTMKSIALSPDMTGNGRGEVLAINASGQLQRYSMATASTLATPVRLLSGLSGHTVYGPGDWSGDKLADVLSIDAAGNMYLYQGNGKGSIGAGQQIGRGWSSYQVTPVGDVNKDGIADLLAIDTAGKLWLYAGNGKGAFQPGRTEVGHGWVGFKLYAAGDLNGDGVNDILGINSSGVMYAYNGKGNGTFQAAVKVGTGWSPFTLAAGADLTGDKAADIVGRRDTNGDVYLYPGKGSAAGFKTPVKIATGW
ncbi:MAG: discoidin domain-containing protein, partial [Bifidobacteriaceae bacterium]|nr:discoidin domain-containing protein [Bifidobacteriaceae bacterium]